jgi:hypothetical protein
MQLQQRLTGSNTAVATTRSGVNATTAAVIAWIVFRVTGWELHIDDPVFIAIVGVAYTAWYRVSRFLGELWPPLNILLFGVASAPNYEE